MRAHLAREDDGLGQRATGPRRVALKPSAVEPVIATVEQGLVIRQLGDLDAEDQAALRAADHFSVDGTMIEASASMRSCKPKDGSGDPPAPGRNGEADFHGQSRSNDTHQSTTDPDARLLRKGRGKEAKLLLPGSRPGIAIYTSAEA